MKPDFSKRHPGPELMDRSDIPADDLYQNYRELHVINKYLGGYRITLKGLSQLSNGLNEISILDVGCGGGDMLSETVAFTKRKKMKATLTGIDLSNAAISYSSKHHPEINWIQQDVFDHLKSGVKYDVIMSTLFMHHFPNEKVLELLKLMRQSCNVGIIINDLHRHPLAFYSIEVLTGLFSKSYLVKHDAPMSVMRGFKSDELSSLIEQSGLQAAKCSWQWAFRYLAVLRK